jgi:hypothetical protein
VLFPYFAFVLAAGLVHGQKLAQRSVDCDDSRGNVARRLKKEVDETKAPQCRAYDSCSSKLAYQANQVQ